jgi:class 3 adenylate cyclase
MHEQPGRRSRQFLAFLRDRMRQNPSRWKAMDARLHEALVRPRAIVFTDTADFTKRVARDGILHFLMVFQRAVDAAPAVLKRHRGRLVKVEADSLLLEFPAVADACAGTIALDALLGRLNKGRAANERLKFSYGIGWGPTFSLEDDVFGLEVNLASKLGEDLAKPSEALLTPAAAAALPEDLRKKLALYKRVPYGGKILVIRQLRLSRRA